MLPYPHVSAFVVDDDKNSLSSQPKLQKEALIDNRKEKKTVQKTAKTEETEQPEY